MHNKVVFQAQAGNLQLIWVLKRTLTLWMTVIYWHCAHWGTKLSNILHVYHIGKYYGIIIKSVRTNWRFSYTGSHGMVLMYSRLQLQCRQLRSVSCTVIRPKMGETGSSSSWMWACLPLWQQLQHPCPGIFSIDHQGSLIQPLIYVKMMCLRDSTPCQHLANQPL